MHITNRILIVGVIFSSISLHAAEISKNPKSTALELHLSPDPAKIVVQYTCDGIITLNPKHKIQTWSDFGSTHDECRISYLIFEHLKKRYPSQITDSRTTKCMPMTYAFISNPNISQKKLVPIIPDLLMVDKQVGDAVTITDSDGAIYDFLLAEDREANMKEVSEWGICLSKELLDRGFTGKHAQMVRFREWARGLWFDRMIKKIPKILKKDPSTLIKNETNPFEDEAALLSAWNAFHQYIVTGKEEHST